MQKLPTDLVAKISGYSKPQPIAGIDKRFARLTTQQRCQTPAIERKLTNRVRNERYICSYHPLISPRYLPGGDDTKSPPCCMPSVLETEEDWMSLYNFIQSQFIKPPKIYIHKYYGNNLMDYETLELDIEDLKQPWENVQELIIESDEIPKKYRDVKEQKPVVVAEWGKDHKTGFLNAKRPAYDREYSWMASDRPSSELLGMFDRRIQVGDSNIRNHMYELAKRFDRPELIKEYEKMLAREITMEEEENYDEDDEVEDDEE